eukprot:gene11712-34439_t
MTWERPKPEPQANDVGAPVCIEDAKLNQQTGVEGDSSAQPSGSQPNGPDANGGEDFSEEEEVQLLKDVDRHVGKLWGAAPPNTLIIVVTGHGDTPEIRRQQLPPGMGIPRRYSANREEEAYAAASERELLGLCFCTVKQ